VLYVLDIGNMNDACGDVMVALQMIKRLMIKVNIDQKQVGEIRKKDERPALETSETLMY
jgi:hypothetical protein